MAAPPPCGAPVRGVGGDGVEFHVLVAAHHVGEAGDLDGLGECGGVEPGKQSPDGAGVLGRQSALDATKLGAAEGIERRSTQPAGASEGPEKWGRPGAQPELAAQAETAEDGRVEEPGDLPVDGGTVEEEAGHLVFVLVGEEFVVTRGDGGGERPGAACLLLGGPGFVNKGQELARQPFRLITLEVGGQGGGIRSGGAPGAGGPLRVGRQSRVRRPGPPGPEGGKVLIDGHASPADRRLQAVDRDRQKAPLGGDSKEHHVGDGGSAGCLAGDDVGVDEIAAGPTGAGYGVAQFVDRDAPVGLTEDHRSRQRGRDRSDECCPCLVAGDEHRRPGGGHEIGGQQHVDVALAEQVRPEVGVAADAEVRHYRPRLLRQAGLVETPDAEAVEHGGPGEEMGGRDDAGTADAGHPDGDRRRGGGRGGKPVGLPREDDLRL